MAASVIDAKGSTVIGTLGQIQAFMKSLTPARGAAVVNMQGSNFVIASEGQVAAIIERIAKADLDSIIEKNVTAQLKARKAK